MVIIKMKGVKLSNAIWRWVVIAGFVAILYYLGRESIQLKHTGVFIIVILVLSFALSLLIARLYDEKD